MKNEIQAAEWYGFSFDRKRAHRALYDAEVTAKLVRAILTGEYKEVASRIRKYCEPEVLRTGEEGASDGLWALRGKLRRSVKEESTDDWGVGAGLKPEVVPAD